MTVWIVDLEPHTQRYTHEWRSHIPKEFGQHFTTRVIQGYAPPTPPQGGAFLNWQSTCEYKATQQTEWLHLWRRGEIQPGDYVLFTDAWNPQILQTRYLADLEGIPITMGGLWHAGAYDPQDYLGRCSGNANTGWWHHTEQALFSALDHNFFATQYHIRLFAQHHHTVAGPYQVTDWLGGHTDKILRVGWPLDYVWATVREYACLKAPLIVSPHRLSPEKQPEIFRDLARSMPQYEWVMAQDQKLSKSQYHHLLSRAKIVFSANLQETLGIGQLEGAVFGAVPLSPNRLSYTEMYPSSDLYPSEWTLSYDHYLKHKSQLMARISQEMSDIRYASARRVARHTQISAYMSSTDLISVIQNTLTKKNS